MRLNRGIGLTCGLAAVGCLVLALGLRAEWQALYAIPAGAVLWLLAGRRPFQAASGLFILYAALTVVGMMRGASALLLTPGCILALVTWDLSDDWADAAMLVRPREPHGPRQRRLASLGAAAGASMLLTGIAALVRIRLPFGAVALIVLIAMGGLLYAFVRARGPLDEK